MEVKKISNKLDFNVEAQCSHGTSSSKGGCKADCKKTKWTNQNWLFGSFIWGKYAVCYKKAYYTCSMTCWW